MPSNFGPRKVEGAVFAALDIEIQPFIQQLLNRQTLHAQGFQIVLGEFLGVSIAAVVTGAGEQRAKTSVEAVLGAHCPRWAISCGFAGGLDPVLQKLDVVIAKTVQKSDRERLALSQVELSGDQTTAQIKFIETLYTCDHVVAAAAEKQLLYRDYRWSAVDMETFGVAHACQQQGVPCFSLRVVSDDCRTTLPSEIAVLLDQATLAGKMGAITATLLKSPGRFWDLLALRDSANASAHVLARALGIVLPQVSNSAAKSA